MPEISQANIDNVIYDLRDVDKAPLESPALTGTPTAPTPSAGDNSTKIATTAFVKGEVSKQIQYFYQQAVTTGTSSQIMRIPASGTDNNINEDTIVLDVEWDNPSAITSRVSWYSYDGYLTFVGSCSAATTANVKVGQKGN